MVKAANLKTTSWQRTILNLRCHPSLFHFEYYPKKLRKTGRNIPSGKYVENLPIFGSSYLGWNVCDDHQSKLFFSTGCMHLLVSTIILIRAIFPLAVSENKRNREWFIHPSIIEEIPA